MLTSIQGVLSEALQSEYGYTGASSELRIQEVPKGREGEFSFCFATIASQLGVKNVPKAATELTERIRQNASANAQYESVTADGIFINFKLKGSVLFTGAIHAATQNLGEARNGTRVIGVEYLSPNTNKPLHLGHVRNGVLGTALANLYKACGHPVVTLILINDRGVHIMKSMLAFQMFGAGSTPESTGQKPDHFVGSFYVRYNQADAAERNELQLSEDAKSSFDETIASMLKSWEDGDPTLVELWKTMNAWVYAGFEVTTQRYGFQFDTTLYESDLYKGGKSIVARGLREGIFETDETGAILYRFPESFGLDKERKPLVAEVLRADGTSNYLTQDLEVAERKVVDYNLHRSIYVVGDEQNDHFRRLFYILKELGYPWTDRLVHYSYAMVELPSGKMKSREGTVVDADELADEMKAAAKKELVLRGVTLDEAELDRRADIIGLAAIKFHFLKSAHTSKIVFDPTQALDFEGDTGPYCLYTYARIRSLIKKVRALHPIESPDITDHTISGDPVERALARHLVLFPSVVRQAALDESPLILVNALLGIARAFNRVYAEYRILEDVGSSASQWRVALAQATANALERGLSILGIETLAEM
jgi:arginyl-tRNA synthetase